jgi:hypothetical protein
MRRLLACLAVSVPVFSTSGSALAASEFTPLAVTELLSKSYAADGRCGFLQSGERQELSRYVAYAEEAATELEGVRSARDAVARGRASAGAEPCSPALGRQTRSALLGARRAMAAFDDSEADESTKNAAVSVVKQDADDLGAYERRMGAYLLELRCRHLSRPQARNFWKLVVKDHESFVERYGGPAVGAAKSRAEGFSLRQLCNSESKELVRSQYRAIAHR